MPENQPYQGNELRIAADIGLALLKGWKIILVFAVAGLLWGFVAVRNSHPIYTAQMILTPVRATDDTTNARLGALGGLASLAGINTPAAQTTTEFRLFVEKIHSRELADTLAQNKQLMTQLYAGEWDQAAGQWREPPIGIVTSAKLAVRKFLGLETRPWTPPDGARLQTFLTNAIKADPDTRRPYLQIVSTETRNPSFAIMLLNTVSRTADALQRRRALVRAQQYIDYLEGELGKVTVEEHRAAIMQTLSEQEKFLMVASSAAPYAAEIFDPPSVSPTPVSPGASRLLGTNLLLGMAAGAALVLFWKYFGAQGRIVLRKLKLPLPRFVSQSLGL